MFSINQDGIKVSSNFAHLRELFGRPIEVNDERIPPSLIQTEISDLVYKKAEGKNFPHTHLRRLNEAEILARSRFY